MVSYILILWDGASLYYDYNLYEISIVTYETFLNIVTKVIETPISSSYRRP